MTEKTTVVVTAPDGTVKTLSGDTAIIFTVENARDFMNGKIKRLDSSVRFVGKDIPAPVFSDIIGELVASLITRHYEENTLLAGYNLNAVSDVLGTRSNEIRQDMLKNRSGSDIEALLKEAIFRGLE